MILKKHIKINRKRYTCHKPSPSKEANKANTGSFIELCNNYKKDTNKVNVQLNTKLALNATGHSANKYISPNMLQGQGQQTQRLLQRKQATTVRAQ